MLTTIASSASGTLGWRPAHFYRRQGKNLLCTLCPHGCTLADGETGACRVRRRRGDGLETATFASSVQHLDAIERKPFYHFRPGARALTLGAPGCSFRCSYCQNYQLSQYGRLADLPWQGQPVDPAAVVEAAAAAQASICLSYSEPILATELTLALARAGRSRAVPVLWKSNGFITPEALARVAPHLAAVSLDLKAADARRHRALTGAPLAPVLATLAGLHAAGVWVEVCTPLIPRVNDDEASLQGIAAQICAVSPDIPWHLLRFTPEFRMRRASPTSPAALAAAAAFGRAAGLRHVYVERALGADGRATHCPRCDHRLISRGIWRTDANDLTASGACPRCATPIPGRW